VVVTSGSRNSDASLDGFTAPPTDATYDGASAETIGTHSLMSKDSTRKFPFRDETFAVASEASRQIAHRLLGRLGVGDDRGRRIDWMRTLHEYLRFPDRRPEGWESRCLAGRPDRRSSRGSAPAPYWLADATARSDWGVDATRQKLEARYRGLEAPAAAGRLGRWLTPEASQVPGPATTASALQPPSIGVTSAPVIELPTPPRIP
jgi:hypothetical protein